MASTTVDSNAADMDHLQLNSVPAIDLALISQPELFSLSLCSSSAFDTHGYGDLVNPKIDRSVFNESAGSRKQTYSRLRLAPATSPNSPSALRRRGPVIRSTNFNAPLSYPDSDSEVVENIQIIGLLKELFGAENISIDSSEIMPFQVDNSDEVPQISCDRPSELNRKRGRLTKLENSNAHVENKAEAHCESDVVRMTIDENDIHENVEARLPVQVDNSDAVPQISCDRPSELNRKRGWLTKLENSNAHVENKAEAHCESDVHENSSAHLENKAKAHCESDMVRMATDRNDIHENVEDRFDVFECRDDIDLFENKGDVVHVENKDDVVHVENKEESTLETSNVVIGIGMASEISIHQNLDVRDEEIINRDGIVVDLVGLGFMEDPYAAELEKRTKGMSREEELLVFLSGLRGEWVSRRKKRKIVDASEFGNALPKGWRLMLACKKKGSGVWLFCRRYLSPNGRQFMSCKEISAYLLSLHGSQDANQMSCNQRHSLNVVGENNMEPADKFDVTNTEVVVVTNDSREENDVSRFLSQAFAYMSGDYGVEVNTGAPDQQPVVQPERSSNGDKCNTSIFNYQDDLLDHKVSSHRRKKSKASVTDGVIIKEGKFECQFCHKTFDERKRYNGHMGSHVRGQVVKIPDESKPEDVKLGGDHNHYRDPLVQALIGTENMVASVVTGKHGGDESNFNLPHGTSADQHGWNTEAYAADKLKFDDVIDMDASETNEALGFEFDAELSHSENNRQPGSTSISNVAADGNENVCNKQETFSEGCSALQLDEQRTRLVSNEVAIIGSESNEQERTSEGCSPLVPLDEHSGSEKCCNEQDGASDGCSPIPLHNQTGSFDDMINGLFESKRETISGSVLHGSNENLESCDIDWDSTDFSNTIDGLGLGLGEDKILGNDPVLDFSGKSGVDSSSFDLGKLHSGFKDNSSCSSDVNLVMGKSISHSQQKLISSCGKEIDNNKDVYGLFNASCLAMDEHDKVHIYGSKEHTRSSAVFDRASSMNTTTTLDKDSVGGDLKAHQQSKTFNSIFTSLSSSVGGNMGVVDKHAPSKVIQEHQVNDTQINNNTGLRFPFPSNNNVPTMPPPAVSENKEKTQFGFRSFFPSENRKQQPFAGGDGNRVNRQSCVVVESKDRSLSRSCVMGSPHESYSSNKMFPTQLNEHDKNPKSHGGLCLAFDSRASPSANQLGQYDDTKSSFGIHQGMAQTYGGVPHNLNNFGLGGAAGGNSMEGGERGFENSFDLSSYPTSRIWDGGRVDETVNSSNKYMVDFVNRNNTQPSGDVVMTGGGTMWRSGDVNVNVLKHDVVPNARSPLVQSSNSFHTFDIISEKGDGGLYEVNQKYNTSGGFESLTLGRSEPTEYTFMTTQNSNSLSRESKGLSYNVHSQPDFNSSFWLGKDALMPSMNSARNRVASICVWCRNQFYEEATPSAPQAGAIGSLCSTCSSGIPQQFNVL